MVAVIPVTFSVKVVVSWHIVVMVPVPLVAARVVVVMACVVPKVTATVMAVTVNPMVVATTISPAIVTTIPTAVGIADVDMHGARAKV